MADQAFFNLDRDTAVLVPTRSLANELNEKIAQYHLQQGHQVWESPNILLWADYLQQLWVLNLNIQSNQGSTAVNCLINQRQSQLIWTQVIEQSRRQEQSLALLNVQQTVKAVQRSWRLLHDWQIPLEKIANDHVDDAQQFVKWAEQYQNNLSKKGLVDITLFSQQLIEQKHQLPFKKLIFYAFDLITDRQQQIIDYQQQQGLQVEQVVLQNTEKSNSDSCDYQVYNTQKDELLDIMHQARAQLEKQPDCLINIVIADLQNRKHKVNSIAQQVFYPDASPLQRQQADLVYRFSLGEPVKTWPAIDVAIKLLGFIKKSIPLAHFGFLLRNKYLATCQQNQAACRAFFAYLQRLRISHIKIDDLLDLYSDFISQDAQHKSDVLMTLFTDLKTHQQVLAFQNKAGAQKTETENTQQKLFTFQQWGEQFSQWLALWGWSTAISGSEMNSVQYQLGQAWNGLCDEFSELALVQKRLGFKRALELLQQMTVEKIFQPKAASSPILISGVYEAIGREVDICYIASMDERYPALLKSDAFIHHQHLVQTGFPEATAVSSFKQNQKVINSLMAGAKQNIISYAKQNESDQDMPNLVSPLFRDKPFKDKEFVYERLAQIKPADALPLELYKDQTGPAWPDNLPIKGGSAIFKNQSNCPFKAFVTHQLGFARDEESEFGLDAMDRGNVVHRLLEVAWQKIKTSQVLQGKSDKQRLQLIEKTVDEVLTDKQDCLKLNKQKRHLLSFEKIRLTRLLEESLQLDLQREKAFSVVKTEQKKHAKLFGIEFNYIIDRVDMLDDGRYVVIDYKTGNVNRKDWLDERPKEPQLPLYALALEEDLAKPEQVKAIAFAQIRKGECQYQWIGEKAIFKARPSDDERYHKMWLDHRHQWPDIFQKLADDFIAGQATVDPIDDKICDYCELQAVCRISQLQEQSNIKPSTIKKGSAL